MLKFFLEVIKSNFKKQICYTATSHQNPDEILQNGFSLKYMGKTDEGYYGLGVYSVLNIEDINKTHFYGNYIIKSYLNIEKYFIFDVDTCKEVFGKKENYNEYQYFLYNIQKFDKNNIILNKLNELFYDNTQKEDDEPKGKLRVFINKNISTLLKCGVKGMIYLSKDDGLTAVSWDTSTITPFAYKDIKDKEYITNYTYQKKEKENIHNVNLKKDTIYIFDKKNIIHLSSPNKDYKQIIFEDCEINEIIGLDKIYNLDKVIFENCTFNETLIYETNYIELGFFFQNCNFKNQYFPILKTFQGIGKYTIDGYIKFKKLPHVDLLDTKYILSIDESDTYNIKNVNIEEISKKYLKILFTYNIDELYIFKSKKINTKSYKPFNVKNLEIKVEVD